MLETAETGQTIDAETYAALEPDLRTKLIAMQQKLRSAPFSVILLVCGDDAAGTREVVNILGEWLDPRSVHTKFFSQPTGEERQHPVAWRFWHELPAAGRIAVLCDDWNTRALAGRIRKKVTSNELAWMLDAIVRLEHMLAIDSCVIVKIFLHTSPKRLRRQKKQIKQSMDWSDVAVISKAMLKNRKPTRALVEQVLEATAGELTPWHLIESVDKRFRNVSVAKVLLDAVEARFQRVEQSKAEPEVCVKPSKSGDRSVLDTVDLASRITDEEYVSRMAKLKKDLTELTTAATREGTSTICAFEGWDAAGKGGTIRRLTATMNPENYRIIPIAAPTDEEKSHHYLWRFWRHIPRDGGFVVFDRTWYGRVLVERVENFATREQWMRAYEEINYFEEQLTVHGVLLLKFWLHIDPDEQLRRFKDREEIAYKKYKIGPEDYRNREKWDAYVEAINDMVARTSTAKAPWHLVPSNDKKLGRVEVLETVAKALRRRLK
jgi:polyphosphate:AMP phosphotransferase